MKEKHIICVCNQKGGVGKTTTAHELAYLFGKKYKTLAIDLDSSLTLSIYADKNEIMGKEEVFDIHDLMCQVKENKTKVDIQKAIYNVGEFDNIFGSKLLARAPVEFGGFENFSLLTEIFELLDYDIIILDMHPDKSTLTQMAYCAATDFIIPADSDRASAEGVSEMAIDLQRYQKRNMANGKVLGILQTSCDMRSNVWKEARKRLIAIGEYFGIPVFDTYIRMATDVLRCKEQCECMNEYMKRNNAAQDYRNLLKEINKIWKNKK